MSAVRAEVWAVARLAGPAVATQLGTMLIGVVDTLMVARVGTDALAAAALGNVWVTGTLFSAFGLVLGIDPIVSQAHGARDGERAGLACQHGVVLALALSPLIAALWLLTGPLLRLAGQDPTLADAAHHYVQMQLPGIPGFLLFVALRQYLQGRTLVRPAMWVALAANGVNALANWALIFGHLGLPALGLAGAGIATAVTRIFLFAALLAWVLAFRLQRDAWRPWSRESVSRVALRKVIGIGLPVAAQIALEVWAFVGATLLAGGIGVREVAAHTIVLNMAGLAFMLPLGISIGASTRVGNLIGAGDSRGVRRSLRVSLAMGSGVMLLSAATFVGLRFELPRLYTADPAVLAACVSIMPIAGAFQLFDGTQVVGCGILRGIGRTRPAALVNFVGYYVLALPVAWLLAFELGAGLPGVWWGLAAGLAVVASALSTWVLRMRVPDSVLG